MVADDFGPGEVINRRVTRHLQSLVPEATTSDRGYHLEGQRRLRPAQIPAKIDGGLCYLRVYVGSRGQFELVEKREFVRDDESRWYCENRLARPEAVDSLSPFEYTVETGIEVGGQTSTETTTVGWHTLGEDLIYGGREAQAGVLLAEKVAARNAADRDHSGSLSGLGSFADVVDNNRILSVDWTAVDELLGPDADTIAATEGFDPVQSDEKRREARQCGFEFLSESFSHEVAAFEWNDRPGGADGETTPAWRTLPDEMDSSAAVRKLHEMRRQLVDMQEGLDGDDGVDGE